MLFFFLLSSRKVEHTHRLPARTVVVNLTLGVVGFKRNGTTAEPYTHQYLLDKKRFVPCAVLSVSRPQGKRIVLAVDEGPWTDPSTTLPHPT